MKKAWFFAVLLIGGLSSISLCATYGGGSGTAADPYQIWDPNQMNAIGLNSGDWGKCFKLMADIDMSAFTGTQYNIIGNSTTPFTGTFDGNGHIIRNLTYATTSLVDAGLFSYTNSATIENLGVESVNLSTAGRFAGGLVGSQVYGTITHCYSTGSVSSSSNDSCTGGLVGDQYLGTITHCYSTSSVASSSHTSNSHAGGLVGYQDHSSITYSYSTGPVTAISSSEYYSSHAGGIVGYQYCSTIAHCYSTGLVTITFSPYSYAGGLVGSQVYGTITHCYSTGSVVSFSTYSSDAGGLVGSQAYGTITHCYSMSSITSSSDFSNAGGLVGWQYDDPDVEIEKCYSTGLVSSTGNTAYKGGLLGYKYGSNGIGTACFWDTETSGQADGVGNLNPDPNGITAKTTEEMQTLSTFTLAEWDFTNETANGTNDIWRMCADGVDYPRLNWESIDGDFQCPDGVSMEDLEYFVGRWLLNNCTSSNNYCGGADGDSSGDVDLADYAILAEHWLEGI